MKKLNLWMLGAIIFSSPYVLGKDVGGINISTQFEQLYATGIPGLVWLFPLSAKRSTHDQEDLRYIVKSKGTRLAAHFDFFSYLEDQILSAEKQGNLIARVKESDAFNADVTGVRLSYIFFDNPGQKIDCNKEFAKIQILLEYGDGSLRSIAQNNISFCNKKGVSVGVGNLREHDANGDVVSQQDLIRARVSWGSYTREHFDAILLEPNEFTDALIDSIN